MSTFLRRTASVKSKFVAHLFPGNDFARNSLLKACKEHAFSLQALCDAKGHELVVTTTPEEFDKHLPDAQFVITTPAYPIALDAARLSKAAKLEVLLTAGVGSGHVDVAKAATQGVTVLELTGSNSTSYATHVTLMTLTALRDSIVNGPVVADAVASGKPFNIAQATSRSMDIQNRNVGVIGAGRVGYRVLLRLNAFDTNLHYTDIQRLRRELEIHTNVTWHSSADAMVAESEVVIVTVPATKYTKGLINAHMIDKMQPGTLLVNASDASVVDAAAVAAALESGHLSGYATDAWPNGAPDAALVAAPNVYAWPPAGGFTLDAQVEIARGVVETAERYMQQRNFPVRVGKAVCMMYS